MVPIVTLLLLNPLLLPAETSQTSGAPSSSQPAPPCALRRGEPTAVVLGGDDAGTGAAWALASLGVKTLLVLTHRRDLGGDPTSFYHDGGHMVRAGGGLNDMLLCSTDSTCSGPSAFTAAAKHSCSCPRHASPSACAPISPKASKQPPRIGPAAAPRRSKATATTGSATGHAAR